MFFGSWKRLVHSQTGMAVEYVPAWTFDLFCAFLMTANTVDYGGVVNAQSKSDLRIAVAKLSKEPHGVLPGMSYAPTAGPAQYFSGFDTAFCSGHAHRNIPDLDRQTPAHAASLSAIRIKPDLFRTAFGFWLRERWASA